ncbi:MAG: type II toxin-antitoxin system RelE/ParE family toxin [Acidobacteria bacterium]|nr:type II toxin-antitoxin system RelE/ParE family toxin [Acidobacteriota bacterium]
MDFKILFADKAITDLNRIVEYYALDSPTSARMVGDSLLAHIRCLALMPIVGTPLANRSNVFKLYHSPYAIYYRVNYKAALVEVLHLYHGVRHKSTFPPPAAPAPVSS